MLPLGGGVLQLFLETSSFKTLVLTSYVKNELRSFFLKKNTDSQALSQTYSIKSLRTGFMNLCLFV